MTDIYFGDVLGSFANGVQLDLRVKLAVDFLKAHPAQGPVAEAAAYALDLAAALLDEASRRGLTKDLPEDSELSAPMKRHIERQIRMQVFQNQAAQRIQSEPAVALGSVPANFVPRRQ
jgi:hypothetical protein